MCLGRLNAAEMFVDVSKPAGGVSTQWIAESGVVDLFLLVGPRPADVSAQYASVTGTSAMPQMFSLGCALFAVNLGKHLAVPRSNVILHAKARS